MKNERDQTRRFDSFFIQKNKDMGLSFIELQRKFQTVLEKIQEFEKYGTTKYKYESN